MRIVKQRQKKTTVYDVKQVISAVVDVYKDLILENTTALVRFGWNLRFDRRQFYELREFSHFIG